MRSIVCGFVLASVAFGTLGCSFAARSPDQYRDDTRALLATRSDALKSCYDAELKRDSTLAGTVTVTFYVEEESGRVANPTIDAGATTAPSQLVECVTTALDGLVLAPADARRGDAAFRWEFSAPGASATPPAGPPG